MQEARLSEEREKGLPQHQRCFLTSFSVEVHHCAVEQLCSGAISRMPGFITCLLFSTVYVTHLCCWSMQCRWRSTALTCFHNLLWFAFTFKWLRGTNVFSHCGSARRCLRAAEVDEWGTSHYPAAILSSTCIYVSVFFNNLETLPLPDTSWKKLRGWGLQVQCCCVPDRDRSLIICRWKQKMADPDIKIERGSILCNFIIQQGAEGENGWLLI